MINEDTHSEEIEAAQNVGGKFLTFFLNGEEYGIEILKVQEIIGMMPITRVPLTNEHTRGVVNLRGKIIPVMDIRMRFGMECQEDTEDTCIIVVQSTGIEIGIVVDKVSEVIDIPDSDIEDVPSFGTDVSTEYLLGVGKTNDNVRLLLAIDRVVKAEDFEAMSDVMNQEVENAPVAA